MTLNEKLARADKIIDAKAADKIVRDIEARPRRTRGVPERAEGTNMKSERYQIGCEFPAKPHERRWFVVDSKTGNRMTVKTLTATRASCIAAQYNGHLTTAPIKD